MNGSKSLSLVIADKSYIIRSGFRKIIQDFRADIKVFEAGDFNDLLDLTENESPDIIIMNIKLTDDPHEDIRESLHCSGRTKILALTGTKRKNEHFAFFDSQICIDDDKYEISKTLSEIENSLPGSQTENSAGLSERECDVLKEVALGKTNKEIADTLYISTHTVITHRKNITQKIGIKTVSGLTVYAILNNIISINDAAQG